jgi:branched-chain amino acid transport system permease protein
VTRSFGPDVRRAPGRRALGAALLALGIAAPFVVYPVFVMQALCFAIYASAFNLLFGYTGLLSFGHAAFFGFAAYITGYVVKVEGLSPELGILLGGLTGAALGAVIGGLAIRRQGIYFAMITFALAEVVYFVCLQAPFTGGEDGLQSVPRGSLLGVVDLDRPLVMYYFVLAEFILCLLLIRRIVDSPFGQVLKGIRENEPRAISLGYRTNRYKLLAFVLSAGLSGIAAGTKTIVMQFASLSDVHWHRSGEVVLMTLLGGVGTIAGPPLGALFVVTLNERLAELGEWVTFILGAIFVACVLAFRQGFVGALGSLRRHEGVPEPAGESAGQLTPAPSPTVSTASSRLPPRE